MGFHRLTTFYDPWTWLSLGPLIWNVEEGGKLSVLQGTGGHVVDRENMVGTALG